MSFTDGNSRYYDGIVKYDTVLVKIPKGMRKDSLHVDYKIMGAKISPLPGSVTDFTHPVVFTVTAEDGSSRQYTVVVEYQTSEKEITGFNFKAADNPGLTNDVTGTIDNNDTIRVRLPAGPDLSALKPAISFVGAGVSPGSGVANDFTRPVTYYVSAEDHSERRYIVMVTQDIFVSAADGIVYIGSTDGYVYALDFVTGGVIWKFYSGYAVSDPIYFDSTVYFGSNNTVYALDATTGAVKWQFVDKPVSFNTPCVEGGVVYLSYNSENGNGIYALDAASGNLVWQRTFGNVGALWPVAIADGRVYVTGWYGDIHAYDALTGGNLWANHGGGITWINPAIANGILYTGDESRNLVALDARTGEEKWEIQGMNCLSSPTVRDGVVYFGAGYVEAADANTGAIIWKSNFYSGNQLTAPVISDNVLFIEGASNLYAVNINDGTLKWKFIYSGKLTNSTSGPTVADDRVICNNDGHGIYALSASTGKLQWTFTAEGLIYTNPCIVDSAGNAFYSGRAGNVN